MRNRHVGTVERMTVKETAGSRLRKLLARLLNWSDTLTEESQLRILEEGIAAFYRQMIEAFDIDEGLLDKIVHVAETLDLDGLSQAARKMLVKMERLCVAPTAFKQDHSADTLFESLIRQFSQLEARVLGNLGPHAWLLYTRLHELEARSRSMDQIQLAETQKVIKGIHLRMLSSLAPDMAMVELVPLIDNWFMGVDEEHQGDAARVIALCLDVWEAVPVLVRDRLPRELIETRLKMEADRVTAFLLEVDTILA